MKKSFSLILLSSLLLLLTATVATAAEPMNKTTASNIVAEVNGSQLTVADFQAYIKMRLANKDKQARNLTQAQRQQIFDEYINRELLYQAALIKGFDKNAMVNAEIENQRRNIVVSFTLQKLMKVPPRESDMQAVYKNEIGTPSKEYKTRHILLKTEAQAKIIINQLNEGKNFAQLAATYSVDASAKKGGELGWFSKQQMVAAYIDAAGKLSNGSYTKTPIQTRFGWHIIHLDGTREVPAPSYAEMKDKIMAIVNNRRITAYLGRLRERATIHVAKKETTDKATTTASSQ